MGSLSSDDSAAGENSTTAAAGISWITKTEVKEKCVIEKAELGKYVKKCQKTKTVVRIRPWKRSEVVNTTTEKTEEDVTEQVVGNPALLNLAEHATHNSEVQLCRLM